MGNTASPPMDSTLLKGNVTVESIEFRKYWQEDEEKYQLSSLSLQTSSDITRDFYYHDLKGLNDYPPLFDTRSIITKCNFIRSNGESHIFRGIWEGEVKPNDTIKYSSSSIPNEIQIYVKSATELETIETYINDESKCKELNDIKSYFISKTQFANINGKLQLEVTKDSYYRSKKSDTEWAIYTLDIPYSLILNALGNASKTYKPKIKIVDKTPKDIDNKNTKAVTYKQNDDEKRDEGVMDMKGVMVTLSSLVTAVSEIQNDMKIMKYDIDQLKLSVANMKK
eukprot:182285_1